MSPVPPRRVLQVFWCPIEHEPDYKPPTTLVWRSAAAVTDLLASPPAPEVVEDDEQLSVCPESPEHPHTSLIQ
ncbi:hypothetical protein ACIQ9P_06720 [Kitasatospora sp. NPDC094019]|uniref:hypothetical protein n=1 Tax=Kitasatospora sp. NPDC094019 TaxID=3364091 RepID=UPI0037FF68DA